jgi:hypothetical protein
VGVCYIYVWISGLWCAAHCLTFSTLQHLILVNTRRLAREAAATPHQDSIGALDANAATTGDGAKGVDKHADYDSELSRAKLGICSGDTGGTGGVGSGGRATKLSVERFV